MKARTRCANSNDAKGPPVFTQARKKGKLAKDARKKAKRRAPVRKQKEGKMNQLAKLNCVVKNQAALDRRCQRLEKKLIQQAQAIKELKKGLLSVSKRRNKRKKDRKLKGRFTSGSSDCNDDKKIIPKQKIAAGRGLSVNSFRNFDSIDHEPMDADGNESFVPAIGHFENSEERFEDAQDTTNNL